MQRALASSTVHHISLRVADLERARAFYEDVLGLELDQDLPGKLRFRLGSDEDAPRLVLRTPLVGTPQGDRFDERRIGLDHIALGCSSLAELREFADALQRAGIDTNGLRPVPGGGHLVAFRDPDNIQWELFGP